jgi:hypothetical protein
MPRTSRCASKTLAQLKRCIPSNGTRPGADESRGALHFRFVFECGTCARRQVRHAMNLESRVSSVADLIATMSGPFARAAHYLSARVSRGRWVTTTSRQCRRREIAMGRGILLWMLGVPIPIILLLALCSSH